VNDCGLRGTARNTPLRLLYNAFEGVRCGHG
jgi:hypothetical protein